MARLILVKPIKQTGTPPTSLPDIPQPGLSAVAASRTQINLTASYSGPPTLATYTFQRAPSAGGTFSTIATQAGATYSDTGLSANTQYFYRVNVQTSESPSRTSIWNSATAVTNGTISPLPPFPRLAAHANVANVVGFQSPAFQAYCMRMNQVVMGVWDGWQAGKPQTFAQIVDAIHAGSKWSTGTKVLQYYDIYRISQTIANYAAYTANNWLVRTTYPSGSLIVHSGTNIANITSGGNTDAGGRTCQMYQADYISDWQYNGGVAGLAVYTNAANPNLDGTWFDDLQFESQDGGDFNRDGVNDNNSPAASSAIRAGFKFVWNRFAASNPEKIIQTNLSQIQLHATPLEIAELTGIVAGGGMEGMLGTTWAIETYSTWSAMMTTYINQMAFCTDPTQVYFMHSCISKTGKDPYRSNTAYQAARYGLASCLMYDAAYCPCPNGATDTPSTTNSYDGQYLVEFWIDEWSVTPGTNQVLPYASAASGLGWMGDPIDAGPITTPGPGGLLVRRFRRRSNNKLVYVVLNPKGNSATNWTAPVNVRALSGVLETTVNNGATYPVGTGISVPVNDARFLLEI